MGQTASSTAMPRPPAAPPPRAAATKPWDNIEGQLAAVVKFRAHEITVAVLRWSPARLRSYLDGQTIRGRSTRRMPRLSART